MADDLLAFLRARLDEDASEADDWHDARRCGALDRDGGFDLPRCDCGYPARVLREVEAKRAILADYEEALQHPYDLPEGVNERRDPDERERDASVLDALDAIARALAAVWSGHPDYRQEWKP